MAEIAAKAAFDGIRYAQAWEDGDLLAQAFGDLSGKSVLGVCASGDNVLSTLVLDPDVVVAADLSPAQISCLRLRMSAIRRLDHGAFMELLGVRESRDRGRLLAEACSGLGEWDREFWAARAGAVVRHGVAEVGRFERYFRLFRRYILPLVHSRRTVDAILEGGREEERRAFYAERWDTWRWRLLLRTFFSNAVMGALGRDPAFFEHVEGSLAEHVARKVRHAAVALDPSENHYASWILAGRPSCTLPPAWREENFPVIRDRLDRVRLRLGDIVSVAGSDRYDALCLSDVFEYMDVPEFEAAYGRLLDASRSGATLAYWNMMVPRSLPDRYEGRATRDAELSRSLGSADKAFFYSAFNVDRVL